MSAPSLRNALVSAAAAAALVVPAVAHADAPPGTVVATRPATSAEGVTGAATVQYVTYRTQNSLNQPATAGALVYTPPGAAPAGGWPVVAWEHGTVGVAENCAPSLAGLGDDTYPTLISTWLAHGYAVVAPDYIGLGTPGPHAYLDGHAEGNATVDAVRAAHGTTPGLSTRWAVVGHSQGGQAALFTASEASSRAPELDFRGTATYAPGASVVDLMLLVGRPGLPDVLSPDMKAYGVYALLGLSAARPDFDLNSYLTPYGQQVLARIRPLCLDAAVTALDGVDIAAMFARPLAEGDFEAIARPVMDVPTSGYDRPILIAQGDADTDVPAPLVYNLVVQLYAHGVNPDVHNYVADDHETILTTARSTVDTYLDTILHATGDTTSTGSAGAGSSVSAAGSAAGLSSAGSGSADAGLESTALSAG
ncbi:lipase family protein [Nocardia stercoris]|nr:lipase family protein [Nocardia stercoris]